MPDRVLVVDDETVLCGNVVRFLARTGREAEGAASAEEALAKLAERDYAVVITDLRMPGMDGIALLERLVERHPGAMVVVMTAYASLDTAIQALRLGAQDYLLKPLSLEELARKVDHLLEHRALAERVQRLRQQLHQRFDTDGLVATAPAMQPVMALVRRAAEARSTVLIEGESGTGKELIARALHDLSAWRERDFIPVNLAAQPADLVDATLFGHEQGAYTGARRSREGVFRAARGGTVFLDEIAELSPSIQVKLLRVLESREVLPLGSDRPVAADFRLVVATNRPLAALVERGSFREDLYFRLNVVRVQIPPLRERREDIAPLASRLLERHARSLGRPAPRLTGEAMRALRGYRWPGNVRELSNICERALLVSDGPWITPEMLPAALAQEPAAEPLELKEAVAAFERQHIRGVLARCGGDKGQAAELLGVHLATLYRHIERLGLKDEGG